ncbi:hypothetical protein SSCI18S_03985 [Sphingobium scionense]
MARCAHSFMSTLCIAAAVIFWLDQWIPLIAHGKHLIFKI